ncbi:MAG: HEAT repeat domain-containing protein, partial [Fidelibacterota bacterium]
WFFDQWIYQGGHPEYEVTWKWDRKRQAVALEVRQVQDIDEVTPLFRMPVQVVTNDDTGTESFTIQVEELEETFYLPVSSKPKRVEFDPQDHVLKELTFRKSKKELLEQLENGRDISRMRAAKWLAEYPDGKVAKALGNALRHDPFRGVKSEAAHALGKMRTKAARDSLLANMRAEHAHVRRAIIEALGAFAGDETVASGLEEMFRNDSSYYVQAAAVKSTAKLATASAYDLCVEALGIPSHKEVIREAALTGLAKLGNPEGLDYILDWTRYGRPSEARTSAIRALAHLAPFTPKRQKEIRDSLTNLLGDPQFTVRLAAIRALGKIGNPAAIPSLKASIEREAHFRQQNAARQALRRIRLAEEE